MSHVILSDSIELMSVQDVDQDVEKYEFLEFQTMITTTRPSEEGTMSEEEDFPGQEYDDRNVRERSFLENYFGLLRMRQGCHFSENARLYVTRFQKLTSSSASYS